MEKIIERKPLGVIDALSSGFELVLRQPWVLLIPIALDLFLWLGPQIRAKPVVDQVIAAVSVAMAQGGSLETQQSMDAVKSTLQAAGDQFNVFSFVALFGMGMPSLGGLDTPIADLATPTVLFSVQDAVALLGWMVLFALVGILLGSVYLEGIGRIVRHEVSLHSLPPRLARSYVNILILVGVVGVGGFILAIPFVICAALVGLLSQGLASFFVLAGWLILLWAGLYLAFAIPAIFVSGSNVAQAIINSITVFRYNFWSAMGLIFLIVLLQTGFSIIWQQLLDSVWGMLVGMVANAVLGTAMVAAGMLFYNDRYTLLTEVRQRIRQHPRPLIKG